MKYKKILPLMFIIILVCSQLVLAITAEEIINKRDNNQHYQSAKVEAEMIIINGDRKMTKTMQSITDGENGLTEFTNPRDRGTKFLKRGDDLFLRFPDAEDIVKMSGHMLQQSMMGSDFSYQDMMESDKLTELYNFEILGEEEYQDHSCYKLEGIKKEGVDSSYYRRVAWVDKERFIGLKEELYARSGRLLKETFVEEINEID